MKLKPNMSCHLLNAYTKFPIDISKHVKKKSEKLRRMDGQTDRQTDGHGHGMIGPFFKRAYKKSKWVNSDMSVMIQILLKISNQHVYRL